MLVCRKLIYSYMLCCIVIPTLFCTCPEISDVVLDWKHFTLTCSWGQEESALLGVYFGRKVFAFVTVLYVSVLLVVWIKLPRECQIFC